MPPTDEEVLIFAIARMLKGVRRIAVGVSSPIPGSATLLHRATSTDPVEVTILNSTHLQTLNDGATELFDRAAQGRIEAFFLSGGQIDGQANINLVGIGTYPRHDVRWSGSFGSAMLYYLVPRVILFRQEHTRRTMVEQVDFISAPGTSEAGVYRPGGPFGMVTGLGVFTFDRAARRFTLHSIHPGHSLEEIKDNTGFAFDHAAHPETTPPPARSDLALLRSRVAAQVADPYPEFASRVFGV